MKLVFVRHGHADHNNMGRLNERNEPPSHLTEKGKVQAQEAAIKLKNYKFDAVYCSELVRTEETAKIILGKRRIKTVKDHRLNEFQTGMHGRLVPIYYLWLLLKWSKKNASYKGNETPVESSARVWSFFEEAKLRHPGDTILVVGHVHTYQAIINNHLGKSAYGSMSTHIANAEIVEFEL